MKKFISILALLFIVILTFFVLSKEKVTATGTLVGWWKLDETTQGSNAVDSSGSGNDGTGQGTGGGPNPSTDVSSTITFSDPRSASFNGFDQYFNCGNAPTNLPSGSQARTISAWIKGNSFADAHGKSIAGWGNDTAGELSELRVNTSSKIEFHGNSNDIAGSTTLSIGQWYYVATTVTSGGAVTLYVNGTQDGTGSVTLNTTEANCKIGRQPDYDGQYFNGLIDDVRFYNSALTPSEISNLAAGNQDPDPAPTSTPTPTPSPTPNPTLTPTPGSNNNNSGSPSSSSNTSTTCTNDSPDTPDLFQLTTSPSTATLYFAPVSHVTGYVISYGTTADANQYTASFNDTDTSGVVSYTINNLAQNETYYFKVQGVNGCMPGNWSQTVKSSTTEIETENIPSSKTAPTPTPAPIGTISVIKKEQTATTQPAVSNPQLTQQHNGYDLAITVQQNGKPVANAQVELHSTPMKTMTDKNGVARFSNVAKGNHTILLTYSGYSGQEKVSINGNKKNVAVNLTIQLNPYTNWLFIGGVLCLVFFITLSCILLFLLKRRRTSKT